MHQMNSGFCPPWDTIFLWQHFPDQYLSGLLQVLITRCSFKVKNQPIAFKNEKGALNWAPELFKIFAKMTQENYFAIYL